MGVVNDVMCSAINSSPDLSDSSSPVISLLIQQVRTLNNKPIAESDNIINTK